MKGENKMKKMIKRLVLAMVIVALFFITGIVIKTGKFKKLEGYMYSFAVEITNSATESDATSSNVQGCATSSDATSSNATSSDATSSNAQECATSSDATSSNVQECATSNDATSSNVQTTETIKVTNTQNNKEPSTPQIKKEGEEVKKETVTDFIYNNSEITQDILDKISNSSEIQSITINLDKNVNISKNIFEAIKGKDIKLTINIGENQLIFNGNSMITSKDINAEISYNLVSKDTLLKEIVQDGVVINFANNGELPGTAIVRIKVTEDLRQALDMNEIFVYYYNEETKELTQMTDNATYNEDGFIEFSINHNSKYVLVNKLIEEKEYSVIATSGDTNVKDKVSFLESHKMYVIIIGVSIIAIVIVIIILIVDKKSKNNKNIEENNNDEKIDL